MPRTSAPKESSAATAPLPARADSASSPATMSDGEELCVRLEQVDQQVTSLLPTMRKLRRRKEKRDESLRGLPKKKRRELRFTAKNADRHELYQLSVQSPVEDAHFLSRVFKKSRDRKALHFREDFCGTGLLSAHWLKRGKENTAEGFDIDPDPIAWGIAHNFESLGAGAARMLFHQKDVREPSERPPDVRCAQNFSYWIFTERAELLDYFRGVHEDLAADGVFVLDLHGGPEAMEEMEEEREIEEGFTYVWDHLDYFPVSGKTKCGIHFLFEDGTEMRNAFRYEWRLWGLAEIRDVLLDAGFASVDCYWEGTDEDGESGNGVFRKSSKGENCLSYIAYLVASK